MKQSILYTLLISISLVTFFIFLPYKFIDHNKTKVICEKNNTSYAIGPNLIFVFDEKLDSLTEKNIRKLCEYAIINDYQDSYKTPSKINYRLEFEYQKEGSWGDALLLSLTVFFLGLIIISALTSFWQAEGASRISKKIIDSGQVIIPSKDSRGTRLTSFVIASIISLIIFQILLKTPAKKPYCERQMASKINNFKKSAYGYGLARIQQEEPRMRTILNQQLQKCLK